MKKNLQHAICPWTKAITVVLIMLTMMFFFGCGNPGSLLKPSRTDKAFEGITKESGMHLCTELDDVDGTLRLDMYRKADNLYIDMLQAGSETILITDGKVLNMLDPALKVKEEVEITEEYQAQLDQIASGLDAVYSVSQNRNRNYKEGTITIDDITYATEMFETDGNKATFAFDSGDRLSYLITESDGETAQLKIIAMDGNVKDSQFTIPEDYTIHAANPDDVNQTLNNGDGTGNDSTGTNTDNGSAKNDSTDTSNIPIEYKEVRNENSGYSFRTKEAFNVEIEDNKAIVYTKTAGQTPKFYVFPQFLDEGSTPDEWLNDEVTAIEANKDMKLTVLPEKTSVEINGQIVPGVFYAVEANDKSKNLFIYHFISKFGYMHHSWDVHFVSGDEQTLEDMKYAMSTFEMLAS